ncbi:hypothetical protein BHM03_00048380 [Ensete ventricosum]|nr:hypothetical protein BHM03_00048380 [Ensete ventricosum]
MLSVETIYTSCLITCRYLQYHLLKEQIAKLKVKDSSLVKENALLREKVVSNKHGFQWRGTTHGMSSQLYTNQ